MKRKRKPRSLNKRLLTFMILCWVFPIAVFFLSTTFSYQRGIIEKSERLMEDEIVNASAFTAIRIGDAIALCQRTSYEKTCEDAWREYHMAKLTQIEYLQVVNRSMKEKFYLDKRFDLYAFYSDDIKDNNMPDCFSSRIAIPRKNYEEQIQPELLDGIDPYSSYTQVRVVDGRIFIVRNLYTTTRYEKYGTMVVELNKDEVFKDISRNIRENMIVFISDSRAFIDFAEVDEDDSRIELVKALRSEYDGEGDGKIFKGENRRYNGYLYEEQHDNYNLGIMLLAKKSEIYSSLYEMYTIVALILLLFIPVICYGVYFLRRQIKEPIDRMFKASKKMEEGEIGIKVGGGRMPNSEFQYLMESFDRMSAQVKYLFDYVYDEKLARKDAQILALQAQINPHFLNNTLEMMNWQARMSGDAVVSKMIESLGTVLDYRMNRANVKEIHLAEELQCTDAYFYIMSMRFGQRLQIEKEIDEELLYILVPPLILQPIVENAIVHGVEIMKNGKIHLKIYHDEVNVYLQVRNSGKEMTKEEKDRIKAILDGDDNQIPESTGKHTSIGIRNVNRRIKLVYGEEYGLGIEQSEGQITVSTITIPYREREKRDSLKERSEVESKLKNMARLNK